MGGKGAHAPSHFLGQSLEKAEFLAWKQQMFPSSACFETKWPFFFACRFWKLRHTSCPLMELPPTFRSTSKSCHHFPVQPHSLSPTYRSTPKAFPNSLVLYYGSGIDRQTFSLFYSEIRFEFLSLICRQLYIYKNSLIHGLLF